MTFYLLFSNYFSHSSGPPFIAYIDDLPSLKRQVDGPFMMPIVDKWVSRQLSVKRNILYFVFLSRYNDMGTIVIGKVESGCCKKGETLLIMPNKVRPESLSGEIITNPPYLS